MEIVSKIYVCVPVGPHSNKSSDPYVVCAFPVVICAFLYESGMFKIVLLALNLNVYFKGIRIIVNSCVPTVGSSLNARTS
jgi:hypothetical protein